MLTPIVMPQLETMMQEGERFDAQLIIGKINSVPQDAIEVPIFSGLAIKGEVDLTNSTALFQLLQKHGLEGTVFTAYIKKHAWPIVEKYQGFWNGVKGDNAEYIFGGLENAVRCSTDIMGWIDRDLTEYIKDYIVAVEILKAERKLPTGPDERENQIGEFIGHLRKIKEVFEDDVPLDLRELKQKYEKEYSKIDSEISERLGEKRGRLIAKSGLVFGNTVIKVSRSDLFHYPIPDFQGAIPYLESALRVKSSGPLSGHKDKIIIASYNPIDNFPPHMIFINQGEQSFGQQRYHQYQTLGVDNFGHPTFDGRIPQNAPLSNKLPKYRDEVSGAIKILEALEDKYVDSSLPSINVSADERTDRYKNGRTSMMSVISLAVIDEIIKIYDGVVSEYKNQNSAVMSHELWYLTNVEFASSIREFMNHLKDPSGTFRQNILFASLLYNIGGSIARATSRKTPQYATRRLSPENNAVRLQTEAANAYTISNNYTELQQRGIPDMLKIQNTSLSQVGFNKEVFAALILKWANRYVHHMSYRAWKTPVDSPEQAVVAIRKELSDLMDEKGYKDRMHWLVENALTNVLGITEKIQMKRYTG